MTFPNPAGSAQHDIVVAANVVPCGQLQDLLAVDSWIEGKVKVVQGFLGIQSSTPDAQVKLLLRAPFDLVLQQPFQEFQVRPLLIDGLVLAGVQRFQDTGQTQ